MKTVKTIVYTLDELSDEAKEKAREWCREGALDYGWWEDEGMLEMTTAETRARHMSKWGWCKGEKCLFSWKRMYFDLEQGSFIQFIGLKVNDSETFRKLLRIDKRLWEKAYFSFDEEPGRQCNTQLIFECDDCWTELTIREHGLLEAAQDLWHDRMEEAIIMLRRQAEYLVSDEAIDESIRANDYTFTAEGERFG